MTLKSQVHDIAAAPNGALVAAATNDRTIELLSVDVSKGKVWFARRGIHRLSVQVRLTAVKSVLGSGAVVDSVRFLTNSIFGLCGPLAKDTSSRAAVAKSSGSGIIPVYRLSLADHRASVVASLSWHEQPEFFIKMGVWTGPLGACCLP